MCYADGTPDISANQSVGIAGTNNSFDAYGNGFGGGYYLKLSGTDANGNLVVTPTLSTNVTKVQ
jgi:hypothetical protein